MLKPYQEKHVELIKQFLQEPLNNYVLKGGTAMMLYYNLNRYSEDIDLVSLTQNTDEIFKIVDTFCMENKINYNIKKRTKTVSRVMIDYGNQSEQGAYPLKVEVSYRPLGNWLKYEEKPPTGLKVLTLESLIKDKIRTMGFRDKIRDFYDAGYGLLNHPELIDEEHFNRFSEYVWWKDMNKVVEELTIENAECKLNIKDVEDFVLRIYETLNPTKSNELEWN